MGDTWISPAVSDLLMVLCVLIFSNRQLLFHSNYSVYSPQQTRVSSGCSEERATVDDRSVTHTCEDQTVSSWKLFRVIVASCGLLSSRLRWGSFRVQM